MKILRSIALALALAAPAFAQSDPAPTGTSKPQPLAIVDTIAAARDVPFPGVIRLQVDASDTTRGIFRVKETIPVKAGPLVLLYPQWIPGSHAPTGTIDKIGGLAITANGKTLNWRRDPVDVNAFHLDVPAGARAIEVQFQFLSPTTENQGRVVMTPEMLNMQWTSVAMYPAGYYTRQIMIRASATYPDGWASATALRPANGVKPTGSVGDYGTVAFDTLMDSPVFAGKYYRAEKMTPDVTLNIFADKPGQLEATPEQIESHRRLVQQAVKLFGAQHYDHYDWLFAVSDRMGGVGIEHHRSSENGSQGGYFTDWAKTSALRQLLGHEFTHSWNGKFRRGADLWTPDYRTPMRNSLLWVYEGQTQLWGYVLAARGGVLSRDEALGFLAMTAASYEYLPGRNWRPLVDTTNDEIINPRRPQAFRSWQRFEDYYSEGQLIWLDVDSVLRERSKGTKSIDDFAKAFFGVRDRDWGELTYTFDDLITTLNGIMPYDWSTFLHDRVDAVRPHAPLDWIARGGYKLSFTDEPTGAWTSSETVRKAIDLTYALGFSVGREGVVGGVLWDSPAFKAGIVPGDKLLAVESESYSDEALKTAVKAAKGGTKPITLTVKSGEEVRQVPVQWNGGLRYPRLERTGSGASGLDALLAAK